MLSTNLLKPRTCGKRGSGLRGRNPEPPTCCLSWGDPTPDLEAGCRALTPWCLPACPSLLQRRGEGRGGGLALLPLPPRLGQGQGQRQRQH